MTALARLRIIYLVAVSLAIFVVHDPRFALAALLVHGAVTLSSSVPLRRVGRTIWNLRFFLLILVAIQVIFPPRQHFLLQWLAERHPAWSDAIMANGGAPSWIAGVVVSVFQLLQIIAMVLAVAVVRMGEKGAFLRGLRGLGLGRRPAAVIANCIDQLEQVRDAREATSTPRSTLRDLLRGDVGWVLDRLDPMPGGEHPWQRPSQARTTSDHPTQPHADQRRGARRSTTPTQPDAGGRISGPRAWRCDDEEEAERFTAPTQWDDVPLLSRITVVLMSLRLMKVTAGTGMTPGQQNLVVIPLLCVAADRGHARWSATIVSGATACLHVMLGLGRAGVFVIVAHVVPGLVVDLGWRVIRTRPTRWKCMLLGVFAGLARCAGMLLVLALLDNHTLLAAVPFLAAGHVLFGLLSGGVTHVLIRESRARREGRQSTAPHTTQA